MRRLALVKASSFTSSFTFLSNRCRYWYLDALKILWAQPNPMINIIPNGKATILTGPNNIKKVRLGNCYRMLYIRIYQPWDCSVRKFEANFFNDPFCAFVFSPLMRFIWLISDAKASLLSMPKHRRCVRGFPALRRCLVFLLWRQRTLVLVWYPWQSTFVEDFDLLRLWNLPSVSRGGPCVRSFWISLSVL